MMVTWWQSLLIAIVPAVIAALAAWYVAFCQIRNAKREMQVKYESENRLHISKLRFDTEFSIYQEVCEKFVTMVYDVMNLFPEGIYFEPPNEEGKRQYYSELYKKCENSFTFANLAINKFACFIDETIFDEFIAIKNKCAIQINWFFQYRIGLFQGTEITKCFERTTEIRESLEALMKKLRRHIASFGSLSEESVEKENKNAD